MPVLTRYRGIISLREYAHIASSHGSSVTVLLFLKFVSVSKHQKKQLYTKILTYFATQN